MGRGRLSAGCVIAAGVLLTCLATPAQAFEAEYLSLTSARAFSPDGVGDLDGDGLADLVETRGTYDSCSYDPGDNTYAFRRGSDGKVLWRASSPSPGSTEIHVTRVGPDARPGVLLVDHYLNAQESDAGDCEFQGFDIERIGVRAVDGKTGRVIWSWLSPPGITLNQFYEKFPLHASSAVVALPAPGRATDLLMQTVDVSSTYFILSGADGSRRDLCTLQCNWGVTGAMDDVDGDGRADLLTRDVQSGNYRATVRSTATGAPIWRRLG